MKRQTRRKVTTRTRKPRAKRASKLDVIAGSTMQDYSHLSTSDVTRKRALLSTENEVVETEIAELRMRLSDATRRSRENATRINALSVVITRRSC